MVVAACGGDDDAAQAPDEPAGQAEEQIAVTIGIVPIANTGAAFYALEEGIFEKHGLDVELTPAQGGAALVPSLVSGDVDFASVNTPSLVTAVAQGIDLRVVAPFTVGPAEDPAGENGQPNGPLVVLDDAPIESLKDLEGKTIAVNTLQNLAEWTIRETLERNDVDHETVEFVEVDFPEMQAALERGRVDAIHTAEPFWSAVKAAGGRMLVDTYYALKPRLGVSFWTTSPRYAEENPEAVERFRAAINEANAHLQEQPEDVLPAVAKHTEIPEETLENMALPEWTTEIDRDSIALFADLGQKYGVIDGEVDIDELILPEK